MDNLGVIWEIINCTYLAQFLFEESEFSSVPLCYTFYSFLFQGSDDTRRWKSKSFERGEGATTREPTCQDK